MVALGMYRDCGYFEYGHVSFTRRIFPAVMF